MGPALTDDGFEVGADALLNAKLVGVGGPGPVNTGVGGTVNAIELVGVTVGGAVNAT